MKLLRVGILASLLFPSLLFAEIAVVVHPSASFDSLSQDQIQRIFLGKTKKFPNGNQAVPLNQNTGTPIHDKFNEGVCNKSPGQYRAYWSQLIFTGKGAPPKDSGGDADIVKLVSTNPNLIGYIDSSAVDGSIKVVYKLP